MNGRSLTLISLLGWIIANGDGFSLRPVVTIRSTSSSLSSTEDNDNAELSLIPTNEVVKKVAVTGATGKTGRLVVEELLKRKVEVVGLVRNKEKALEVFSSNEDNDMLSIQECILTDQISIAKAVEGCDATIWCATGFADETQSKDNDDSPKNESIFAKVLSFFGIDSKDGASNDDSTPPPPPPSSKQSIDIVGIPIIAKLIMQQQKQQTDYPKVVMLSSAGITRPSWDEKKKEQLRGCADIHIKAESEQKLREVEMEGVGEGQINNNYCIVRPCGLNDDWPEGARPIFSQGDVAVGRINRNDVAKILCDVLSIPEACSKTFEVIGMAGYPAQTDIGPALSQLKLDTEDLTESEVYATYLMAQQLLPGERQDAAALAMGQTYEQLDKGETGRLGERGKENAEAAAPKPTTTSV
ncbi:NAD(P)-binding protein [Fragilariopsis cylindrus CCMP1102]|uniref:NAD(P)-binding protein n=1 Tax=Fragilariopsis cylindrus CCMP1102 TaxID=635003 RepID=A0A1E7FJZ9_9STRA|nr:NAD(P)-binding protein [Fragilariopsis cylindrus CCMP1102]|eukprot:OEU18477.1 NAD(P)-binding protein [Fragilariopsis cylindrus CCMP1102]